MAASIRKSKIVSRLNILLEWSPDAVTKRCSVKKVFLKISQNSRETPVLEACNFIQKDTPALVFSDEFCEILRIIIM